MPCVVAFVVQLLALHLHDVAGPAAKADVPMPLPGLFRLLCGGSAAECKIEPIVLLTPKPVTVSGTQDTVTSPDPASQRFNDTYYRPGTSYEVVGSGKGAGHVSVVGPYQATCVSIAARVKLEGGADLSSDFVTNSESISRAKWNVRTVERRVVGKLDLAAGKLLASAGCPPKLSSAREGQWSLVSRSMGLRQFWVGVVRAPSDERLGMTRDGEEATVWEAVLVAEGEPENPKFTYTKVTHAASADVDKLMNSKSAFIGAIDIDGDGVAELVFENHGPEGYEYTILRRGEERWEVWAAGGGSGC